MTTKNQTMDKAPLLTHSPLLHLLQITPSPQSLDYILNKGQFHLHTLLTEQSHPATRELSRVVKENTLAGIEMLFSVDRDIEQRIGEIAGDTTIPDRAVDAVCRAIREGRRIYVYGCGATGRLAKQMESAFWRPFWEKVRKSAVWAKLASALPANIDDLLIGEMTGGDRALVSSLEGFEDLQVIGRLQLADHGISRGDVVFCVTEGGETSSVIGTILAAFAQYGDHGGAGSGEVSAESRAEARSNLFFLYNNPDELLMPFDRSRSVLENDGITKLNLTTGPQAITGSTRMQATTIETFVLGCILEEAISITLKKYLTGPEMATVGLVHHLKLPLRLNSFTVVRTMMKDIDSSLAALTNLESEVYRTGHTTFCFANRAMSTVFTDCTERSPTFRLWPLDPVTEKAPKSWIQVWTGADDASAAWKTLLGREFRGMDKQFYQWAFESISDPFLREIALKSLSSAGNDQRDQYDFSLSGINLCKRGPGPGDLCILVCLGNEAAELNMPGSGFHRFLGLARAAGAKTAILLVQDSAWLSHGKLPHVDEAVALKFPRFVDPMGLRMQVALKMMMNAHSTAVMARLGRVTGNSMTAVNPGNLKLIGRATFLIMELVNRALQQAPAGVRTDITEVSYTEANAVLFDCIANRGAQGIQHAEVALCIIRILESVRTGKDVGWKAADALLKQGGLDEYLNSKNKKTNHE